MAQNHPLQNSQPGEHPDVGAHASTSKKSHKIHATTNGGDPVSEPDMKYILQQPALLVITV